MRIEIPEYKKWVHEMRFKVRWGDMDAMGHVNNAMYFRYLETARIDWMVEAGMAPTPGGQGPVIVNAFCNFHQQLAYPDEVLLKMYVSDPGLHHLRDLGNHGTHLRARRHLRRRGRHRDLGGLPEAEGHRVAGLGAEMVG